MEQGEERKQWEELRRGGKDAREEETTKGEETVRGDEERREGHKRRGNSKRRWNKERRGKGWKEIRGREDETKDKRRGNKERREEGRKNKCRWNKERRGKRGPTGEEDRGVKEMRGQKMRKWEERKEGNERIGSKKSRWGTRRGKEMEGMEGETWKETYKMRREEEWTGIKRTTEEGCIKEREKRGDERMSGEEIRKGVKERREGTTRTRGNNNRRRRREEETWGGETGCKGKRGKGKAGRSGGEVRWEEGGFTQRSLTCLLTGSEETREGRRGRQTERGVETNGKKHESQRQEGGDAEGRWQARWQNEMSKQEERKETEGDRWTDGGRGQTERTSTKQTEPECILITAQRSRATPRPYWANDEYVPSVTVCAPLCVCVCVLRMGTDVAKRGKVRHSRIKVSLCMP